MGIKDLLRFLKPYTQAVHVEKYGGKRVGIDAYSWLHKGAYSCSMEISLDSDSDAKFKYISYFMHRIDMLRHYNVVPVVVFDGGSIPCKSATEDERYRRREANRELAMEKLKEGNIGAATELFQRAISITTSMVHQLIKTLRGENVEFMVAPYEADAQLAYLSSLGEEKGGIAAVITEDSDLLAYGCSSVIFKMDKFGNGEEVLLEKVFNSTNCKPSFQNFTRDLFTGMCVLAGCDFLPSIPGIGIGRAYSLVSKYYNIDRVLSVLKFEKGDQMPEDYLRSFRQAAAVFQHARVYDKITKRIDHIKPLDQELLNALDGELDFLGSDLPPSIAIAISEGIMDPRTMEAYDCSQNSRRHGRNASSQNSRRHGKIAGLKQNKEAVTTEVSCFTVYSSQKNKGAKISSEVPVLRQVLKERNYSNESVQLAKETEFPSAAENSEVLIENSPNILENSSRKRKYKEVNFDRLVNTIVPNQSGRQTLETIHDSDTRTNGTASINTMACDENPVKPPNNNPFKRCNQVTSNTSGISTVSDKSATKTPFKRCDQVASAISGNSLLSDKDPCKTPDDNPFNRKCYPITSDLEGETFAESCMTEAETKSNMFSPVLDSQQSVNSKPRKIDSRKGNGSRTRLKNSDCNNSSNRSRKSTILDFFSHAN